MALPSAWALQRPWSVATVLPTRSRTATESLEYTSEGRVGQNGGALSEKVPQPRMETWKKCVVAFAAAAVIALVIFGENMLIGVEMESKLASMQEKLARLGLNEGNSPSTHNENALPECTALILGPIVAQVAVFPPRFPVQSCTISVQSCKNR